MTPRRRLRYEGYILDLDGTVYLGDQLIPGARRDASRWLRAAGRRVVFLSNKPLEPRAQLCRQADAAGHPHAAART